MSNETAMPRRPWPTLPPNYDPECVVRTCANYLTTAYWGVTPSGEYRDLLFACQDHAPLVPGFAKHVLKLGLVRCAAGVVAPAQLLARRLWPPPLPALLRTAYLQAFSRYAESCTVLLRIGENVGTGTLVKAGSKRFLVTCYHLIEGEDANGAWNYTGDLKHISIYNRARRQRVQLKAGVLYHRRGLPGPDFAVFRLTKKAWRSLTGLQFVGPSAFASLAAPISPTTLAAGFPTSYGLELYSSPGFFSSTLEHVARRFRMPLTAELQPDGLPFDPHGMSGCSVWSVTPYDFNRGASEGHKFDETRDVKVIGILTSGEIGKYILGTPWSYFASALLAEGGACQAEVLAEHPTLAAQVSPRLQQVVF